MRGLIVFALCMASAHAAAAQQSYGIPSTHSGSYGAVNMPVSTVAQLPVCNALHEGILRGVNDANSAAFNATAAGGSTNHMMVYCDGTNWKIR